MEHTMRRSYTASPRWSVFGRHVVLATLSIAIYAATAAFIAHAEDEVEWIDLTGTERVPVSENVGLFLNDTFNNFWYEEVSSNTIDMFSSKKPVGLTLIFR